MTGRPKILCIEDDPATGELLAETLEEEGFEPLLACDGTEGVRRIDECPSLILCDVEMPHMSGFDVLRHLRKSNGQLRNIPFLFITAYGNRVNAFGPVHHTNPDMKWVGPGAWRSKGNDWTYGYTLKPMGILVAPTIKMVEG